MKRRRLPFERRSNSRNGQLVTAGFLGGMLAGLLIWSMQMRRSRRDLFSANPLKRLAALGYLGGQSGVEAIRLLTEYIRWEKHPMLRKRAERHLRRAQATLV